ncbi:MAG: hypothetical protein EBR30_14505 [Cytophagia bacterium]|nr:hypothetical protein [Cytophagia bacterium]
MVDLVQRVYNEKSKGNIGPIERFDQWLKAALTQSGAKFSSGGQSFSWKIISAEIFNDVISDDETDWMLIQSEDLELILLGKLYYGYSNILGQSDKPILGSFWLIKSNYEGLNVDGEPIHIRTPHHLSTPKHRIEADLIKLISCLRDKDVEITKYVDYKTHRIDTMRIR